MNNEWVEYEKGARERAEAVRRSEDPEVRAAIDAVNARKLQLAVDAAAEAARLVDLD
jgi:hypothetical protein